ncbi:unnamed protein product [Zymoseptoria tritici ST99CH_3D7]|uniref:BZIP domain-containing protein n=1 Tax=Zymoseptoria tritici (strain ST99CH_3D7) TaxID=1276538 RepID=A0A1X7RDC8_ZYMT9|nr:unnamed protein product [Zymoseptoria tritici ST99CH_3D7]
MAAVASRSNNNSPHLTNKSQTGSPASKRNSLDQKKEAPTSGEVKPAAPVLTVKSPEDTDVKATLPANAPLAPPPRPNQNGNGESELFGEQSTTHLSKEPNPFENAFGNPVETPGKTQLPGVTSLTSPASLLPGITPGWPGSLRSGPLSPAMLTGPTGSNDYFNSDHHFAGSFPTPNESSLRTGLTPGGGGSMFPQPSPNSQALYNQLQNGGATPGTLDFHRTAMNARAQNQVNSYNSNLGQPATTPQQNPNIQPDLDSKSYNNNNNTSQPQHDNQDPFGSHQTNDAANGLFMLAQAGGQQRSNSNYPIQQQQQQGYQQQQQAHDTRGKGSIGTMSGGSTDGGEGQYSDDGDQKPQTRNGRGGKKGSTGKAANGKRKTEEAPAKGPASKKQRASMAMSEEPEDEDDGMNDTHEDGRKMTDEEKRKNFLERNRVAALKCRQRKKQWLANLQQKVEIFSTENDALAATVTQLREEIVGLKTLLMAHKDCPVSQAQGISGLAMQQIAGDAQQHYANPYGMMGQGMQQQGMQQSMQRR